MTTRPAVDLADDEELATAYRVGRAWRELRRGAAMGVLRDHLFGAGDDALEPGQVDTLDLLVQRESWRMSDLADALRVDPSTATRAVQRLVRAGLAERGNSDDDGRVVMVSVTTTGRRCHDAVAQRRRQTLSALLAEFDPAERGQLAALLERFVRAIDDFVADLDMP
ncbi:MAG: MarR family winged helix-turn-helix transcriptional regulator [Acidimicrobiia bacterium]